MSRTLISLAISALDELDRVQNLQELLEICLDQYDFPTEKTKARVELLLTVYLKFSEQHLEQLKINLEQLRNQTRVS